MGNLCETNETQKMTSVQMPSKQQQEETMGQSSEMNLHFSSQQEQARKKLSIDDFEMLNQLGKGAFGKVYKVKKKDNSKIYALKAMNKKQIFDSNLEQNAVIEKEVLNNSKHPFIVHLKYSFQSKTKLYFVMEYIDGGEFYQILQRTQGLPEPVVQFVAAEVILALEYLNMKLKIIYRDLKPENLLLTKSGHVKLTDFGLATKRKESNIKSYTLVGTTEYLAPEIIRKDGHSFEVDLWTLGILIYEMIAGKTPFSHPERNQMKIQYLILKNNPVYPPTMSRDAKDLINSLLQTNPQLRLGANGYDSIKNHSYFSKINWQDLYELKVKSPLKTFAEENSNRLQNLKPLQTQIKETPVNTPIPQLNDVSFSGNEMERNSSFKYY
ncbi:unnamed protein product [Paramecium pentaurelia]|uniref:non-specific serine/threonine protein kinase n=1 Tax=Paramecium pentaurelia TaxID=43138 RepID=A0A8S1WV99_9CILI|nr:unnamed protein product [Paramecium pentaurelia]